MGDFQGAVIEKYGRYGPPHWWRFWVGTFQIWLDRHPWRGR